MKSLGAVCYLSLCSHCIVMFAHTDANEKIGIRQSNGQADLEKATVLIRRNHVANMSQSYEISLEKSGVMKILQPHSAERFEQITLFVHKYIKIHCIK